MDDITYSCYSLVIYSYIRIRQNHIPVQDFRFYKNEINVTFFYYNYIKYCNYTRVLIWCKHGDKSLVISICLRVSVTLMACICINIPKFSHWSKYIYNSYTIQRSGQKSEKRSYFIVGLLQLGDLPRSKAMAVLAV